MQGITCAGLPVIVILAVVTLYCWIALISYSTLFHIGKPGGYLPGYYRPTRVMVYVSQTRTAEHRRQPSTDCASE